MYIDTYACMHDILVIKISSTHAKFRSLLVRTVMKWMEFPDLAFEIIWYIHILQFLHLRF